MRKTLYSLLLVVFMGIMATSCIEDDDETTPYVVFTNTELTAGAFDKFYELGILASMANWTLTQDEESKSWAELSGVTSADSSETVKVILSVNTVKKDREATFYLHSTTEGVKDDEIIITQLAEPDTIMVDNDTVYIDAVGGDQTFEVDATVTWESSSEDSWLLGLTNSASKTVLTQDLNFTAEKNDSLRYRIGNITLSEVGGDAVCNVVVYQFGLGTLESDKTALIELYNNLGGASWSNSWDVSAPIESWYGVTVASTKSGDRVTRLMLDNNNVVGELPASVGDLNYLEILSLQDNSISGSLPQDVEELYYLNYLYLTNNQFSGDFSMDLEQMHYLNRVYLGNNQFEGNFPSFDKLSLLTILDVSNNNFTGEIPSEFGATGLVENIFIQNNRLTGAIPFALTNNPRWRLWDVNKYICPQQTGFGFTNCKK